MNESFTTASSTKTWETMTDDFENDESASAPIEVSLPRQHDGGWTFEFYCDTNQRKWGENVVLEIN